MLNQMAGPLFRELAEGLALHYPEGAVLLTGHPDTLLMEEQVNDKLLIRQAPGYDRSSLFKRLYSWSKYLLASTRSILGGRGSDAFLIVSNPPLLGAWFWLLNQIRRRPYAVLVYDIHPDVLVMMGMLNKRSPIVKGWRWINRKVYRDAEVVVTLGGWMAARLMQPEQEEFSPVVIPPWADTGRVLPLSASENPVSQRFNPQGKQIVLYSGNMGISHDIDSMLEAARRLRNRDDLLFLFIGNGQKWGEVERFKQEYQLKNIELYPFQPEELLPMTMALATISLVALDRGAEGLMVPSKLFYYLAAGSAVIGICRENNELRDVISDHECGLCVEPGTPDLLAAAIEGMLDNASCLEKYRQNARKAAVEQYSKEAGVGRFVSTLQQVGMLSSPQSMYQ